MLEGPSANSVPVYLDEEKLNKETNDISEDNEKINQVTINQQKNLISYAS